MVESGHRHVTWEKQIIVDEGHIVGGERKEDRRDRMEEKWEAYARRER